MYQVTVRNKNRIFSINQLKRFINEPYSKITINWLIEDVKQNKDGKICFVNYTNNIDVTYRTVESYFEEFNTSDEILDNL